MGHFDKTSQCLILACSIQHTYVNYWTSSRVSLRSWSSLPDLTHPPFHLENLFPRYEPVKTLHCPYNPTEVASASPELDPNPTRAIETSVQHDGSGFASSWVNVSLGNVQHKALTEPSSFVLIGSFNESDYVTRNAPLVASPKSSATETIPTNVLSQYPRPACSVGLPLSAGKAPQPDAAARIANSNLYKRATAYVASPLSKDCGFLHSTPRSQTYTPSGPEQKRSRRIWYVRFSTPVPGSVLDGCLATHFAQNPLIFSTALDFIRVQWWRCLLCISFNSVPSPRRGFGGVSPPQTKLQASPNWNMKHYKSVEFCQFLECPAPPQKRKAPPIENFLATVLFQLCIGFHSRVLLQCFAWANGCFFSSQQLVARLEPILLSEVVQCFVKSRMCTHR